MEVRFRGDMLLTDVSKQSKLPQEPQPPELPAVPEGSPVPNILPESQTRLETQDLSKETDIYNAPVLDQSKNASTQEGNTESRSTSYSSEAVQKGVYDTSFWTNQPNQRAAGPLDEDQHERSEHIPLQKSGNRKNKNQRNTDMPHTSRERRDDTLEHGGKVTEETLPVYKISLLIINRFPVKMHTELNVKVTLDEISGRVCIFGNTEDDLNSTKIKMYEQLNSAESRVRTVTKQAARLLTSNEGWQFLRSKLQSANIDSAFDVDAEACRVTFFAFYANKLEDAAQLLDRSLYERTIELAATVNKNDIQSQVAMCAVNNPLLSVEMTNHSVSVVGLLEQDVNTVVAEINKAIKDNKILQTELVDLKADQARCFDKDLQIPAQYVILLQVFTVNIIWINCFFFYKSSVVDRV